MVSTAAGPRHAGPCHAAMCVPLLLLHCQLEVLPLLLLLMLLPRQPLLLLLSRLKQLLPLMCSDTDECMLSGDDSVERHAKVRLCLNSCGAMPPRRHFPGVLARIPHRNPVVSLRGQRQEA